MKYEHIEINGNDITLQGLHEDHVFENALPELKAVLEDEFYQISRGERIPQSEYPYLEKEHVEEELRKLENWVEWLYKNCRVTVVNHNLN